MTLVEPQTSDLLSFFEHFSHEMDVYSPNSTAKDERQLTHGAETWPPYICIQFDQFSLLNKKCF